MFSPCPLYPSRYDQINASSDDHFPQQHKRIDSKAKHFHFIVTEQQDLDKFIDDFFEMNNLGKRSKKQLYISAQHVIQNPEITGLEFRNRDFFENGGCKSLSNRAVENCEYFHGPLARFKK